MSAARTSSTASSGRLTVSEGRSRYSLMDAFVEAGVEAGHPGTRFQRREARRRRALSAHPAQRHALQRRGRLSSSCARPSKPEGRHGRAGDPDPVRGARANGVEIARHGELQEVHAETEVILSAGAYNSPQLLHAFGYRPGRRPRPADDPRSCRSAGRRGPAGSSQCRDELAFRHRGLVDAASPAERRTAPARRSGATHLEHRRGLRVFPHARRSRSAGHPVSRCTRQCPHWRRGSGRGRRHGVRVRSVRAQADEPRQAVLAHRGPRLEAAHPAQLLRHGGRPTKHDRGLTDWPRHRRAACASRAYQGAERRPELDVGRRCLGLRPALRIHHLSPDQHLRDRTGGRQRTQGDVASKGCGSWTLRSCRASCAATPTPRRS